MLPVMSTTASTATPDRVSATGPARAAASASARAAASAWKRRSRRFLRSGRWCSGFIGRDVSGRDVMVHPWAGRDVGPDLLRLGLQLVAELAIEFREVADQPRGHVEIELRVPEIRPGLERPAVILARQRHLRAGLVEIAPPDQVEGFAQAGVGEHVPHPGSGVGGAAPVEAVQQRLGLVQPVARRQERRSRDQKRGGIVRRYDLVTPRFQRRDTRVGPCGVPGREARRDRARQQQDRQQDEQVRPDRPPSGAENGGQTSAPGGGGLQGDRLRAGERRHAAFLRSTGSRSVGRACALSPRGATVRKSASASLARTSRSSPKAASA